MKFEDYNFEEKFNKWLDSKTEEEIIKGLKGVTMEIEVGEYVRSRIGSIGKVTKIEDNKFLYEDETFITWTGNVIKHGKNILDLIEVGDFINGERILDITGDYIHTNETNHNKFYLKKHIKTILTKEQFELNCYKLN